MNSPFMMLYNIITVGCNVHILKMIIVDKKLNMTPPDQMLCKRGLFHKFPEELSNKCF